MTALYIAPRVPVVDPMTGVCSPIWYRFFSQLFNTVGDGALSDGEAFEAYPPSQTDAIYTVFGQLADNVAPLPAFFAPPVDDLMPVAVTFAAQADDLTPAMQPLFYSADDVLPAIMGLNDQIAMLRAEIDDLHKGTTL